MAVRLRSATLEDTPFLRQIHASIRGGELAAINWPPAQLAELLAQQFNLQHAAYRNAWPRADFSIVLVDETPAGRLYVDRDAATMRLIDIALLPAWRGLGLGTRLLLELTDEAERTGRRIIAHVESHNPALSLYQRLGFATADEDGIHLRLEWQTSRPNAVS